MQGFDEAKLLTFFSTGCLPFKRNWQVHGCKTLKMEIRALGLYIYIHYIGTCGFVVNSRVSRIILFPVLEQQKVVLC